MKINNLSIKGGNQQFADNIINQYDNAKFEKEDVELLKFVAELETAESAKQKIGKDIATVNNTTIAKKDQNNARNSIAQFLLDHKGDINKWAGRISKILIASILAKYGLTLTDIGLSE
ncbi:hypothetical protein [uncultured Desulfobacter sp.]|uniref:hypothetical protein n=1 Tax=uncultured Desulfobacter sp. TaxID=240139 RepID=UPI0029C88DCD|nr:hypothetical protein [uncultured Desulfobacter sp.]